MGLEGKKKITQYRMLLLIGTHEPGDALYPRAS